MGYVRVAFGALMVEEQCAWATVKDYTAPEKDNQVHCFEGARVRATPYALVWQFSPPSKQWPWLSFSGAV